MNNRILITRDGKERTIIAFGPSGPERTEMDSNARNEETSFQMNKSLKEHTEINASYAVLLSTISSLGKYSANDLLTNGMSPNEYAKLKHVLDAAREVGYI